jgi:hypothetical protein
LVLYLRVFTEDREILGHLANISQEGMMVISDEAIDVGRDFDLWLELPSDVTGSEHEHLALRAHSVRCAQDVNPSFYDTGFRLLDVEPATVNRIASLINNLRMGG